MSGEITSEKEVYITRENERFASIQEALSQEQDDEKTYELQDQLLAYKG